MNLNEKEKEDHPHSDEAKSSKEIKKRIGTAANELKTPETYDESNPDIIKLIIAAKKERRNQKGQALQAFVLVHENGKKDDEFSVFLDTLQKNLKDFSSPTRFQLAVYNKNKHHWTPFDIVIENQKINLLCFDASNNTAGKELLNLFLEKFPSCNAYNLEADKVRIDERDRVRLINMSPMNCSRMTVEHTFRLSKSNFIYQLMEETDELSKLQKIAEQKKKKTGEKLVNLYRNATNIFKKKPKEEKTIRAKTIRPDDVLKVSPDLYRVTESWSVLESFGQAHLGRTVSRKGSTLREYAEAHTTTIEYEKDNQRLFKKQNHSIAYKSGQFAKHASEFLESHSPQEVTQVMTNSAAIEFVSMTDEQRIKSTRQQLTSAPIKDVLANVLKKLTDDTKAQAQLLEKRQPDPSSDSRMEKERTPVAEAKKLSQREFDLSALHAEINNELSTVKTENQHKHLKAILEKPMPADVKKALESSCSIYLEQSAASFSSSSSGLYQTPIFQKKKEEKVETQVSDQSDSTSTAETAPITKKSVYEISKDILFSTSTSSKDSQIDPTPTSTSPPTINTSTTLTLTQHDEV